MVAEGRTTVVTRMVDLDVPGPGDLRRRAGLQSARRRAPGRPRPEDRWTMSPLLEIDDLTVDFSRDGRVTSRALRGVSLTVDAGEAVGVVGETGCGKTLTGLSVLRMLPRTRPPRAGSTFDGQGDARALGSRAALDPRAADQHGLPEPGDELQSGLHGRLPDRPRCRAPSRSRPQGGPGASSRRRSTPSDCRTRRA